MGTSVLNLNVGILGHVDSGKTSLAKALSTTASTASFDKNPESQERGITIDLGFSSLLLEMPQHLKNSCSEEKLQLTLVDCPGHASLIRTIIGGIGLSTLASQLPQHNLHFFPQVSKFTVNRFRNLIHISRHTFPKPQLNSLLQFIFNK
jgi:translation elongation factor EF-1alpha